MKSSIDKILGDNDINYDYKKSQVLIQELISALEICLEGNGRITWAAEHDAEIVLARAKRMITA